MAETQQKDKSFEELTDLYQRYKLLSKIEQNVELEPIIKYVTEYSTQQTNPELSLKLKTIEASLMYDEARLLLGKQKIFLALDKLKKALNMLEPHRQNPTVTYLYFRVLNQLAYFLAQNSEHDESLKLLEDAEILYEKLDKTDLVIFDTEDLFQEIRPRKNRNKFEKLITNNLHVQGWIYNRQQLTDKFTVYYHMVLRRQLETQDSSALQWVFKCARLASYFFGIMKFTQARYLLSASYYVLREYELDLLKHRAEAYFVGEWTNLQKYYADLGKYWVKYGLFLLDASRRALPTSDTELDKSSPPRKSHLKKKLQTIEEKPEEYPKNLDDDQGDAMNKDIAEITKSLIDLIDDKLKDEDCGKSCIAKYISMLDNLSIDKVDKTLNYQFVFPSLTLGDIESKVTDELVVTLESARNLFLFTQEWLKRSKAYYSMQEFPLDYVNLILDLNELYRYLSLYEINIEMQYDVQKRRVDLLEKLTQLLKEYRPQFYLTLNIELVNELTQAQIELILLNLRRVSTAQSPAQLKEDTYRKMNALIDIRKRLSRKDSLITYCTSSMKTSLSEPGFS